MLIRWRWDYWIILGLSVLLQSWPTCNGYSQSNRKLDNHGEQIHTLMTGDEKRLVFGSEDEIPDYELVRPIANLGQTRGRYRRDFESVMDADHENVEIPTIKQNAGRSLSLSLKRRRNLASVPMKVEVLDANGTDSAKSFHLMDHPNCLYHGKVKGLEQSAVAVSTCTPGTMENSDQKLVRRVREDEEILHKTIETAVFVDSALYSLFAKENPEEPIESILDMVFTLINGVQILYDQPALSVQINIVLVRVVILKSSSTSPSKKDGDINAYLKSFCHWQAGRNTIDDEDENHWDHALMLTGVDLFMDEPDNTIVIGLAWVSGMCHHEYSCSLNEGNTFESVYVISHELGHNLGMQHDGDGNDCSDKKYIMSSSLGPGKTTWSSCSDQYLREFVNTRTARCLNDLVPPYTNLDHRSFTLPGQKYPASEQCRLSYGRKYRPYVIDEEPFDDPCRELWCANGSIARRAHPALVGTRCANAKVCYQGKCVSKSEVMEQLEAHNLLPEDTSKGYLTSDAADKDVIELKKPD